jgi:hypothetical protein
MAIPTWPPSLPVEPLKNGYTGAFPNNILMSQGDAGQGKTRRKGATPPFPFSFPMLLTTAQLNTLKTFVHSTLFDGTLRFSFTDPWDGTVIEAKIEPVDEKKLFEWFPNGKKWNVTLGLKIMP